MNYASTRVTQQNRCPATTKPRAIVQHGRGTHAARSTQNQPSQTARRARPRRDSQQKKKHKLHPARL